MASNTVLFDLLRTLHDGWLKKGREYAIVSTEIEDRMRLYRSMKNKKVAGIFGGLGEILSIDPTILRLIYAFLVVAGVLSWVVPAIPFVLAYLVAWMIIPKGGGNSQGQPPQEKNETGGDS